MEHAEQTTIIEKKEFTRPPRAAVEVLDFTAIHPDELRPAPRAKCLGERDPTGRVRCVVHYISDRRGGIYISLVNDTNSLFDVELSNDKCEQRFEGCSYVNIATTPESGLVTALALREAAEWLIAKYRAAGVQP